MSIFHFVIDFFVVVAVAIVTLFLKVRRQLPFIIEHYPNKMVYIHHYYELVPRTYIFFSLPVPQKVHEFSFSVYIFLTKKKQRYEL